MINFAPSNDYRECGDCNMCCQGFLPGNIHGYQMTRGIPCHFAKNDSEGCGGCTIYEDRPKECRDYVCVWKTSPQVIPQWMQPNKSGVILSAREDKNEQTGEVYEYINMKETFEPVSAQVLNQVLRTCMHYNKNLEYEVNGSWFYHGSGDWINYHVERYGGQKVPGGNMPENQLNQQIIAHGAAEVSE